LFYRGQNNLFLLVLTFENYDFRFINGEAYRNNPNTEEISVKVYVDDELVIVEAKKRRRWRICRN
jgi:hypothetical protein